MEIDTGNTAWVLASSALVLLMTPGLALFYGGLVRSKNVGAMIMQSFTCIGIVGVIWVLWGYSLAFGPTKGGLIGDLSWFGLKDVGLDPIAYYGGGTIPHQAFMIFQAMFAIITPALITGAFADRMKFSAFVVFIALWSTLVYSPVAHWVWAFDENGASGWIGKYGSLDFAGGTVVHINAGIAALAAAALVFKKRVRFQEESMEPHNVPMVVLGAGILWFGWFGFNAGSALSAGGLATSAFVVTNTAAAAALLSWVLMSWLFNKKPSIIGAASGAVAGLVAITPASGFVGAVPAVIIGLVAGAACYFAVQIISKLKIDDSLAVFGVHGVGGIWGAIATGLFLGVGVDFIGLADGVSRGQQIWRQLVGIGATMAWSFVVTTVILLVIKMTIGLQVKKEEEEVGLDISQHGEPAYKMEEI